MAFAAHHTVTHTHTKTYRKPSAQTMWFFEVRTEQKPLALRYFMKYTWNTNALIQIHMRLSCMWGIQVPRANTWQHLPVLSAKFLFNRKLHTSQPSSLVLFSLSCISSRTHTLSQTQAYNHFYTHTHTHIQVDRPTEGCRVTSAVFA